MIVRLALTTLALAPLAAGAEEWSSFHGDLAATKYSPAAQITPENVGSLERAWEHHTGDVSEGGDIPKTVWSATPLYANGTLYIGTPFYRILALEPDTGAVKWSYDTESTLETLTQPALKTRGVAYWEAETPSDAACERRIYIGTMDAELHAVDADSGEPCADFADGGVLDVDKWNTTNDAWPLSLLQPPTVAGDTLLIGWAGKDWFLEESPPGTVFAVDARTGEEKWRFNAIPDDLRAEFGTANVWTHMSVDRERGIAYLPVSSPSPNYFGGGRTEEVPRATSVTAVRVETGEVLWSRQLVRHDIWDFDTVAAPTLVDIERDGRTIPALAQPTKMGYLFVLDRTTGEPVFPIKEREVPASYVKGEEAAPTQPHVETPEPTNEGEWPGVFWLSDLFGGCSERVDELRYDGRYTPPSTQGTLVYPATAGGMQWGGGALDPETNTFFINTSHVAQIYTLIPRPEYEEIAGGREPGEAGYFPQEGTPYGFRIENFTNAIGLPCWKPPYGTMSAYDLDTGDLKWRVPFGQVQKYGFYMPRSWGSPTIGGPAMTKGGVLFIGASMDARVRAVDARDGSVLWQDDVEAPAVANPAVYVHEGRQYVVFVAGGNPILKPQVGDQIVAYALSEDGS